MPSVFPPMSTVMSALGSPQSELDRREYYPLRMTLCLTDLGSPSEEIIFR